MPNLYNYHRLRKRLPDIFFITRMKISTIFQGSVKPIVAMCIVFVQSLVPVLVWPGTLAPLYSRAASLALTAVTINKHHKHKQPPRLLVLEVGVERIEI